MTTKVNRSTRGMSLITALVLATAAWGCSDSSTGNKDGGADGPVASDSGGDSLAPDAGVPCTHKVWTKGTQAFKESSSAWKLEDYRAVRISVADIDGDGWADMVPRYSGSHWVLRNNGKGQFEDITSKSGLFSPRSGTTERKVEIVSFADVDNDGDLDAYTGVSSETGGESELMLNNGDGTFKLGSSSSPLRSVGQAEVPAGGSFIDYDLDGNVDIWVTQNGSGSVIARQDRLYRGDGKGGFTDATSGAGLTTTQWSTYANLNAGKSHTRAWGSLACDLNGDGLPELMSASYGRSPNHLWQAQSSGGVVTFTNRSVASGYAFDDDKKWQDNQFARCYCKSNPSAEGCSGCPAPQISCTTTNWNHAQDRQDFRLGGNSSSTSCADLNNDGFMDLVTGEIRHWWAGSNADGSEVLVNSGKSDVAFTRPGDAALGLAINHAFGSWDEGHMTQVVFDFDNDGLLDIYQGDSDYPGTRGRLYHQIKDTTKPLLFEEVPLTDWIQHNRSHGVVATDFDRDGDLDLVVGHSRARCGSTGECYADARPRLFENVIGNKNAWIQLKLVGDGSTANKAAIGAQVKVGACGMTQTQQVNGGYGHFSMQNDMVLHFGAGDAAQVNVTVRWPDKSKTVQSFTLATKKRYEVVMGKQPTEIKK